MAFHGNGSCKAFAAGSAAAVQNADIRFGQPGTQNTELRRRILHIEQALLKGWQILNAAGTGQNQAVPHPAVGFGRQNNCLNANLNKTIGASVRQLNAIKIIQENIGLESLSEGLMELALLRLANPEASLEELRSLSVQKLTKSGINHRFAKILETAQKIEKDKLRITTL